MASARVEILLLIATVLLAALVAVPAVQHLQLKSRRAEVALTVDGIKRAQHAYRALHGRYLAAGPAPRAAEAVDSEPIPWTPDADFDTLAFVPELTDLRGSYTVVLTPGGFQVTGTCDIDGDGEAATYIATESPDGNATLITPADVY